MLFFNCEPVYYRTQNGVKTPSSGTKAYSSEASEFQALIAEYEKTKDQRAAEAVSQFLNDSTSDPQAAVLFKNNTSCNIIIRINGNGKSISFPVEKNSINYLMLDKGTYTFKANLCKAKYSSGKTLTESLEIAISEQY